MRSVTIEIPVSMSEQELDEVKRDLAVLLYQRRAVSLAKAAKVAGLTRIEFQRLLASRQIPINYSETDLDADLQTLRALRERASRS
jgi:predicted HTH domain antitoxin